MNSGITQTIGAGDYAAIDGDLVTWTSSSGLWLYDISIGVAEQIADVPSTENPGVWGDQIVWTRSGVMYGYQVTSGETFEIPLESRPGYTTPYAYAPRIHGNTVTWVQFQRPQAGGTVLYDVYAMTIPEPSTATLALAIFACSLAYRSARRGCQSGGGHRTERHDRLEHRYPCRRADRRAASR